MIRGVGIDVVRIDRMRSWISQPSLLARYFHPREVETIRSRGGGAAMAIATRFAAKEAFAKALGSGLRGMNLRDMQVVNDQLGKPDMVLHGKAKEAFERIGGTRVFLSLTHESDNAIAMVVIEGDDPSQ